MIFRRGRSRSQTAKQRGDTTRVDRLHFATLEHHWSAYTFYILPMLVFSLEEQMEIEDGKRAPSRQWSLCMSLALIHRIPLISREWFHTEQIGDGIKTQFLGSI